MEFFQYTDASPHPKLESLHVEGNFAVLKLTISDSYTWAGMRHAHLVLYPFRVSSNTFINYH